MADLFDHVCGHVGRIALGFRTLDNFILVFSSWELLRKHGQNSPIQTSSYIHRTQIGSALVILHEPFLADSVFITFLLLITIQQVLTITKCIFLTSVN